MKFATITLLALAVTACDDGAADAPMDTGEPGVAVSKLSKWGLEECPAGLEEVDGYCAAGTIDMQLDIDDCNAVAHCFDPPKVSLFARGEPHPAPSCGVALAEGFLDPIGFPGGVTNWDYEDGEAQAAIYLSYFYRQGAAGGLHKLDTWTGGSFVSDEQGFYLHPDATLSVDADGRTECLIDAEADVVQDHWKWSKVRANLRDTYTPAPARLLK